MKMKVTKEDVEKAFAEDEAADAEWKNACYAAANAVAYGYAAAIAAAYAAEIANAAWDKYTKLKEQYMRMKVTKEEVDKAKAAAVEADAAADTAVKASYGAWNKYRKLKEAFKNGN